MFRPVNSKLTPLLTGVVTNSWRYAYTSVSLYLYPLGGKAMRSEWVKEDFSISLRKTGDRTYCMTHLLDLVSTKHPDNCNDFSLSVVNRSAFLHFWNAALLFLDTWLFSNAYLYNALHSGSKISQSNWQCTKKIKANRPNNRGIWNSGIRNHKSK